MIDAPWYIDWFLGLIMTFAAIMQYIWIANNGHSAERWLMAVGWTGLAARVVYGLVSTGNVSIAAASVPFLLALAGGTVLLGWRQLFDAEVRVNCLQEPQLRCYREDRIARKAKRVPVTIKAAE